MVRFDRVNLEMHLGGIYFDLEQYDEAEAVFHRANSPYLQQSNNIYLQAVVLQGIGINQMKQMKLMQAKQNLQECIWLWQQVDDKVMEGNSLGTLAECYELNDEQETALSLYREAVILLADFQEVARAQRLSAEFQNSIKRLVDKQSAVSHEANGRSAQNS